MNLNLKREERYVEIPGLEISRVDVITIGNLKQVTCLSRVVTEITRLQDYFGFKTCKFNNEPYVILKAVTNSIPLHGTNENELIEVELIPYDQFIKIPIKNKELIQFGIKGKPEPKIYVPNPTDEALQAALKEVELLKAKIAATETKEKEAEKETKTVKRGKTVAEKIETTDKTDDSN